MHQNSKFPHICFERNWKLDNQVLFQLGQCQAYINSMQNTPIRPDYRKELNLVALVKGAQATTAIEGNTLTFDQIIELRKTGKKMAPSKEYLQIEVDNIIDALNGIQDDVLKNKRISLITPELIKSFHKLVGKDLGKHFEAIPGRFRTNHVSVGNYVPPKFDDIPEYIENLCEWLRIEFKFGQGQDFSNAIQQAIITHIYIAWIHPFSDGNGRTGRLLEFYLLLRAGVPDIASHVLSNHYNLTRAEYYRQIEEATKKKDLSNFIKYAVQGFLDGLEEVMSKIQENQLKITWLNYIYVLFESKKGVGKASIAIKRRRQLALSLPTDTSIALEEIPLLSAKLNSFFDGSSKKVIERDLEDLLEMNLVEKTSKGYRGRIELLKSFMATSLSNNLK